MMHSWMRDVRIHDGGQAERLAKKLDSGAHIIRRSLGQAAGDADKGRSVRSPALSHVVRPARPKGPIHSDSGLLEDSSKDGAVDVGQAGASGESVQRKGELIQEYPSGDRVIMRSVQGEESALQPSEAAPRVDATIIADKVYRMILRDLKLERERGV